MRKITFTLATQSRLHIRHLTSRLQSRQEIAQRQKVHDPESAASLRYRQESVRIRTIRPARRHVTQVIQLVAEHHTRVVRVLRDHGDDRVPPPLQGMERMRDQEPSPFRSARRRSLIGTPSESRQSRMPYSTASSMARSGSRCMGHQCGPTAPGPANESRKGPRFATRNRRRRRRRRAETKPCVGREGSCGIVDEPFGPARALRDVWTSRGRGWRLAHRIDHTRGLLDHRLYRTTTTMILSIWI